MPRATAQSRPTFDGPTLNPALRDFWTTPARHRVLYGGRSSSKSWDAAGFAIFLAQAGKFRFLCTRQFQNRIEESVYTLLKIQIERWGLRSIFDVQKNKITCTRTGSEFVFYGLCRHIDEVKSMEGIDILWSEEAHLFSEAQWEVIEPTLRAQGSQHWFIFNPRLSTDYVWRRFVVEPPPNTVVRGINFDENPFLSDTIRQVIEAKRIEDAEDFAHIYLGVPRDNDDSSIIKRSHIMAAIDAHRKLGITPAGPMRIGFDVADDGEDYCALVEAQGQLALGVDLWKAKEDELLRSCTRVWTRARMRRSKITYDAIGVGAHAGAKFNELNEAAGSAIEHEKFFAGGEVMKPDAIYADSKVTNKAFFSNIKAQAWWGVADRFRDTYNAVTRGQPCDPDRMIFISSDLPHLVQLIDELSTPKKDYDLAGRVKVESKKDLYKREIKSPNLADAFIMAYLPGEMKRRSFFG